MIFTAPHARSAPSWRAMTSIQSRAGRQPPAASRACLFCARSRYAPSLSRSSEQHCQVLTCRACRFDIVRKTRTGEWKFEFLTKEVGGAHLSICKRTLNRLWLSRVDAMVVQGALMSQLLKEHVSIIMRRAAAEKEGRVESEGLRRNLCSLSLPVACLSIAATTASLVLSRTGPKTSRGALLQFLTRRKTLCLWACTTGWKTISRCVAAYADSNNPTVQLRGSCAPP